MKQVISQGLVDVYNEAQRKFENRLIWGDLMDQRIVYVKCWIKESQRTEGETFPYSLTWRDGKVAVDSIQIDVR